MSDSLKDALTERTQAAHVYGIELAKLLQRPPSHHDPVETCPSPGCRNSRRALMSQPLDEELDSILHQANLKNTKQLGEEAAQAFAEAVISFRQALLDAGVPMKERRDYVSCYINGFWGMLAIRFAHESHSPEDQPE